MAGVIDGVLSVTIRRTKPIWPSIDIRILIGGESVRQTVNNDFTSIPLINFTLKLPLT
jgi:hypothetical protein